MSNLSIAQRLYKRQFSSEGARQELIAKKAKGIEEYLSSAIQTNDIDAFSVCDDMPGYMDTITIMAMVRAARRGDAETVLRIVNEETDAAIKRVADYRAIAEVEAMKPEDFLPD